MFSGELDDRMDVRRGRACAVEILRGCQGLAFLDASLHPDFVDPSPLPVGEQADAVAGRHDVLETLSDLRHREFQVHVLPHRERRLHVQRDLGHDAKGPQIDDRRLKRAEILAARDREDVSSGRHDLECRDRRREVPVVHPRAVRAGRAGACDGDVRQRGQIVEREAVPIERRAQLAVAHSRLDRHRPRRAIESDDLLHLAKREKLVGAVSNPVEAMPGAEHLEMRVRSDERLDLRQRPGRRDACGAVLIIAGPVAQWWGLRSLSRDAANHGRHGRRARDSGALPDEPSSILVHDKCSCVSIHS